MIKIRINLLLRYLCSPSLSLLGQMMHYYGSLVVTLATSMVQGTTLDRKPSGDFPLPFQLSFIIIQKKRGGGGSI